MTPHFDNRCRRMIFGTFLSLFLLDSCARYAPRSSPDVFVATSALSKMTASMAAERKEVEIAKRRKKATLSLPPSNGQQILYVAPSSLSPCLAPSWVFPRLVGIDVLGIREAETRKHRIYGVLHHHSLRLCHFAHSAGLINYPSAICLNENFLPCCTE